MFSEEYLLTLGNTTTSTGKLLLKKSITSSNFFFRFGVYLTELDAKLSAVDGTDGARILNAILIKLNALGFGEVEIRNGEEGLWYNQRLEREAYVRLLLSTIFGDEYLASIGLLDSSNYGNGSSVGRADLNAKFI